MVSRLLHVTFALILAGAANTAFAEAGSGIGRAGTYPTQYGQNAPSHKDLIEVQKEKPEQVNRGVAANASEDVGGVASGVSQSGLATAAPSIYNHH